MELTERFEQGRLGQQTHVQQHGVEPATHRGLGLESLAHHLLAQDPS